MKLKNEYVGAIITLTHPKLGKITLDTTKIEQSDYEFYYENGFSEMFITETKVKKYKGIENDKKEEGTTDKTN